MVSGSLLVDVLPRQLDPSDVLAAVDRLEQRAACGLPAADVADRARPEVAGDVLHADVPRARATHVDATVVVTGEPTWSRAPIGAVDASGPKNRARESL